jgi:hypothetical protein
MPIGLGTVSTTGIAEMIAQTYDPVFVDLRDTGTTIKKLLFPDTKEGNDKIRFHLNANDTNPVRSVSETQLNSLIDATILDTTTGSGTQVGGAFLTPNLHPVVEANLDIRYLTQSIMIGAVQLAAIKGGKDSFANILTRTTKMSMEDWKRAIDDQLLEFPDSIRTGTAAPSPTTNLNSLGTGLAFGSTTYANVNYSTYPEFKPYASHNSGTTRALSIALMQDMMNKLESGVVGATQRYANIDLMVCGAAQFTAYGNLLTAQRRFTATETLDGGFKSLDFNGRPLTSVPRFNASKILFAQKTTRDGDKSYEYRVLKNYDCQDKSDNIVAGVLLVCTHMANSVVKGRLQQGVLMDLT